MSHPYLTVGAVFRRETRYLREWLEFHRMLGVERFYLFNHDQPVDRPASDRVLAPYVADGSVENFHFDIVKDFQMVANRMMVDLARVEKATWIAILDLDEFLFPVQTTGPFSGTLPEVLRNYEQDDIAGLAVWWRCYGTSGLRYPPMLQTESFIQRAQDYFRSNYTYKYIFRPERVDGCAVLSPHRLVDENFNTVVENKQYGNAIILRINHYATRSHYDWKLRVRRGLPPEGFRINPKDLPNFYGDRWELFNHNEVEDTVIHRYMSELKRRMDIEY